MKFLSIAVLMVGIILLFNLGGITTPSTGFALRLFGVGNDTYISNVPDYIEDENSTAPLANFKSDPRLWALLISLTGLTAFLGVKSSVYGSAPPINYVFGALMMGIAGLILVDMIAVITKIWEYAEGWMRASLLLISVTMSLMFIVATISFIMGSDG